MSPPRERRSGPPPRETASAINTATKADGNAWVRQPALLTRRELDELRRITEPELGPPIDYFATGLVLDVEERNRAGRELAEVAP